MRALWPQLASWIDSGEPFALATVVAVTGSAPRPAGACMVIAPEPPRFLGSTSSGCLDAEVVEAARAALRDGEVRRLGFGPDGRPPWSDGLSCGGQVEVRVEPWWGCHPRAAVRAIAPMVRGWLESDAPGVVLSRDDHHLALDPVGRQAGEIEAFPAELVDRAQRHLRAELPPAEIGDASGIVFFRTLRRRPRLLLVGGGELAARLVVFARELGFATWVVDPRQAHAAPEGFRAAPDRLIRSWPQELIRSENLGPRDAAVVITHDPKIDDPALLGLLGTKAGYIGALGSSRSHARRLERLREAGAEENAFARIHGPAGIHLGTPDAAGIALGIMAGIARWQAVQEAELRRKTDVEAQPESSLPPRPARE